MSSLNREQLNYLEKRKIIERNCFLVLHDSYSGLHCSFFGGVIEDLLEELDRVIVIVYSNTVELPFWLKKYATHPKLVVSVVPSTATCILRLKRDLEMAVYKQSVIMFNHTDNEVLQAGRTPTDLLPLLLLTLRAGVMAS